MAQSTTGKPAMTGRICCRNRGTPVDVTLINPPTTTRTTFGQPQMQLDNQLVAWLIHWVSEKIGIFEAKSKLSELCSKVAESGAEYVITRRGRAIARIVAPCPEEHGEETGILSRMRRTEQESGPIPADDPDFPEVWNERWGCTPSPLDENDNFAAGNPQ
jgi:antitoxin (DNA-binding transcriptional repressor) of toxin-antitoxin stability system